MSLAVDVRRRRGDFALDVRFEASAQLTALFGRSGSGKTTLMNLVAGLDRPDEGRIAVAGAAFADRERRVFLPPHRRRVGVVFQDARLFPHMSVRANLRYAGWFSGRRGATEAAFNRIVDLLGIGHLLARRPATLSGGERQRVAIGRALLSEPRLLLMDEPLASLDEARKAEILPYLERLRDEALVPILYVSHSPLEVLRLAGDMLVLDAGRLVAQGPPATVLGRLDLLPDGADAEPGRPLDTVLEAHDAAYGLSVLRFGTARLFVPQLSVGAPGDPVRVRVRARDVMLSRERPVGISALNVLPVRVAAIRPEAAGRSVEVVLDCAGRELAARVTLKSSDAMELRVGLALFAVVKAVSFERGGGAPPAAMPA